MQTKPTGKVKRKEKSSKDSSSKEKFDVRSSSMLRLLGALGEVREVGKAAYEKDQKEMNELREMKQRKITNIAGPCTDPTRLRETCLEIRKCSKIEHEVFTSGV